jgi:hypothetical protein
MGSPTKNQIVDAGAPKSGTRRRVLTGAVGATSVLMTVGSRPALGGGNCMSFVTWQSVHAGTSLHNGCSAASMATGYSPDDWINTTSWPSPYTPG